MIPTKDEHSGRIAVALKGVSIGRVHFQDHPSRRAIRAAMIEVNHAFIEGVDAPSRSQLADDLEGIAARLDAELAKIAEERS